MENNTPGKKAQQFTLTFAENYFKSDDTISYLKQLKWYWRWLGFHFIYQVQVLNTPIQHRNNWTYSIQPKTKILYWLIIKLHTKELNNGK